MGIAGAIDIGVDARVEQRQHDALPVVAERRLRVVGVVVARVRRVPNVRAARPVGIDAGHVVALPQLLG